jgi:hypothetical protein
VHDEATAAQLRELIAKGAMRTVFRSDDCRKLYETLKARGVTDFIQEPTEHGYGIGMRIRDPFGNYLRILQQLASAQKRTSQEAAGRGRLKRPQPSECVNLYG